MFDIDSMPDLLKPCGIVYSKNYYEPLTTTRIDDSYQLIQDILIPKSQELYAKSEALSFSSHQEGFLEATANASVISAENVTPITPPFSIDPVNSDQQFYSYTNLHKV